MFPDAMKVTNDFGGMVRVGFQRFRPFFRVPRIKILFYEKTTFISLKLRWFLKRRYAVSRAHFIGETIIDCKFGK